MDGVGRRSHAHWSEGYDRRTADVIAVQDEIARSVVDRLKIALAEFPRHRLVQQYRRIPERISAI